MITRIGAEPLHRFALLALGILISSGCGSLSARRLGNSASTKPAAATSQSSISQLGVALPAMKAGDDRELAMIAAQEMHRSGYPDEAVELYLKAETLAPKKPKLDAELAPALASAGRYPEAIVRYRRLLAARPEDVELRNNLAWTLLESGDLVAAEAELRAAILRDAAYQPAMVNLGIVLAKQNRYEDSFAVLLPAIGAGPAHHNLAIIAIEQGDEHLAKKHLELAGASKHPPAGTRQLLTALQSKDSPATIATTSPAVTR